mgnify:CR=1 FL=1
MSDLPAIHLLLGIVLAFGLAGIVKGVLGLGLPTLAMGLLGLVMAPGEAAAVLILPSLVTNLWQLFGGPSLGRLIRRLWPMQAGICVGTAAAAGQLTVIDPALATAALGSALAAYALLGLSGVRFPAPGAAERWLSPLIGLLTGLVTAVTGVFVIPAVPYLQALRLGRDELVQALALSFTVSTLALAIGLAGAGVYHAGLTGASIMAVLPALLGMWAGQRVRAGLGAESFRRWFFAGLLGLGLAMLGRAVG